MGIAFSASFAVTESYMQMYINFFTGSSCGWELMLSFTQLAIFAAVLAGILAAAVSFGLSRVARRAADVFYLPSRTCLRDHQSCRDHMSLGSNLRAEQQMTFSKHSQQFLRNLKL